MSKTYQELLNEFYMLQENINRMFVISDVEEFENMYESAKERLETLYKELYIIKF